MKQPRGGRPLPFTGAVALLAAVLTLASIPMAMAKFASTGKGGAQARVARWAPTVDLGILGNCWGKTVFMAQDKNDYITVTNDGNPLNTSRGSTATPHVERTFLVKAGNLNGEVRTKYTYSLTTTNISGISGWLHIDDGRHALGYGTGYDYQASTSGYPLVGPAPGVPNTANYLNNYALTLDPFAADNTGWQFFVFPNKNRMPASNVLGNCYAKVKFVCTATQVD